MLEMLHTEKPCADGTFSGTTPWSGFEVQGKGLKGDALFDQDLIRGDRGYEDEGHSRRGRMIDARILRLWWGGLRHRGNY